MQELHQEFLKRARSINLKVDCAMDGTFSSQIAIVGEAPGPREVQLKVPLVGGSGGLLWSTLKKHSMHRSEFYITNVVKRQLALSGLEENSRVELPKVEVDHWVGMLRWELSCLPNLKYVLILGNMALTALLEKKGITKWRGSVVDFEMLSLADSQPRTYKAIVANNPAAVLREPKTEIAFLMDIAKLPKVISGKWSPYVIEGIVCYDYKSAIERIKYYSQTDNPISFDIETGGGETACIGLADHKHIGTCIPFRGIRGENYFSLDEEADIRLRLQSMFADKRRRFVAQNANFDMYWLWLKDKIRVHSTWFDTMLAHHCLYPGIPHDLGFLCTQYTTHPYYKDERAEWKDKGDINLFWQYNVKDICITLAVQERLLEELKKQKMDDFFFNHIMRLQPNLVRMTVGGVLIDGDEKEKFRSEVQETVADLLHRFHEKVVEATGDSEFRPNPNSVRDRSELYFNRLKLVGRGTSTDAANRERMRNHPRTSHDAKEILNLHDRWAKDYKFLSTYAESEIDVDGRMRCEWRQTGTQAAPGRLSSGQTLIGTGANLQNQPTKARRMFIADEGYVFIYFDLSQAEARYVAWEANIPKWKEQFERARLDGSYDCHRALASEMFRVPYEQVPTADEDDMGVKTIRYIAKRCRHGLNYRMAADKLAETTGLPLHRAHESYVVYHRLTPELRKWWATLEQEARSTRMLYNAFGRRLYIMERLTEEALESIVAFKPQSTIGDKVSKVIYQCHEDDKWDVRRERICLNVHDALVGLATKDRAKHCLSIMKKYAEEPIFVRGEPMIIPADLAMSVADEKGLHRWSNLKKLKL
jgi:uracil-DNA glycosylase family 4